MDTHEADDAIARRLGVIADAQLASAETAAMVPPPTLMELAEELVTLSGEVADLEAQLKTLKGRRDQLRKVDIPDGMRAAGMVVGNKGSFTFTSGKVHLETRLYAGVKEHEDAELFAWLRAHEHGEIIKETVSGSTLGALVRELREDGAADPPHVAVYEETTAKLSITKSK